MELFKFFNVSSVFELDFSLFVFCKRIGRLQIRCGLCLLLFYFC